MAEGLGSTEIARRLLDEERIEVTPEAISVFRRRHGLETRQHKKYPELVPWVIKVEHQNKYLAKMLRLEGRRRTGGEITEAQERRLDHFLARLKTDGVVVTYDRETGWSYVPARPWLGEEIIKLPLNDDGRSQDG